jgi:5-bromo-4-chloroindolyl phosphate hydrolysis protein
MNPKSLFYGLATATLVLSFLTMGSNIGKAIAQNVSSNQTTTNQTMTNQTASKQPQLTSSDIQGIRKFVEDVKSDIANGKAIEALKTLNQIDDKLLVAMSANPPPMLEKSTDNNKK